MSCWLRWIAASGLLSLSLLTNAAQATVDVKVGDTIRFFDGPGSVSAGEYGVDNLSNGATSGYPADFISFCVQTAEFLDFNAAGFKVDSISTQSIVNQNAQLAQGTAYLYTQFRNGALQTTDGLYGSGSSTEDAQDANALQRAIWYLQFGRPYTDGDNAADAEALYLITLANSAISSGAWSGIGDVRIANISWATARSGFLKGAPAQDILVLIPEPATLAMWSLFGSCALVYRRIRRRSDSRLA